MNAWIESRAWLDNEPGRALQEAWDREASRWDIDAKRLRDAVMTRSRLRSRGAELASVLKAAGSSVRSEVFLEDDDHQLYGQLDLVIDNPRGGTIIDLKTGSDAESEGVRTQLLIYAHLLQRASGHLPASLVAFSLQRGPIQVEFSSAEVEELLAQYREARTQLESTRPDAAGCKYCRRRLICEPHWNAAVVWESPDCIEGKISKWETAGTGMTAVRIGGAAGERWVTGLSSLRSQALKIGSRIRVTEVAVRGEGAEREWRATRSTRISVVPEPI